MIGLSPEDPQRLSKHKVPDAPAIAHQLGNEATKTKWFALVKKRIVALNNNDFAGNPNLKRTSSRTSGASGRLLGVL